MFHYEILWFYQDFKSENLCFLNLYPVHAVRILGLLLEIMLSILKRGTNTFGTLIPISSCRNRYHISIFRKPNSSMFFKMC